jgi:hypothetical protein
VDYTGGAAARSGYFLINAVLFEQKRREALVDWRTRLLSQTPLSRRLLMNLN